MADLFYVLVLFAQKTMLASSSTSREKEVCSPSDSSSSVPPSDISLPPGSAAAAPPSKKPRPLVAVSFHHLCPLAPVCFYLFLTLVRPSMLKSNAASLCNVDATKGQPCASISFSSGANVEGSVKAARCCVKHQRAASLKGINRFLAARWGNPACLQPD